MNLRIDQTLRCKHRHKAGADDRKRQTKRKNALHQPIFFSAQWSPPCIIVFLAKPEEKIFNFCRFSFPWQVIFTRHIIIVIIACISSIFNSEILFFLPLFRQNILRYTARYEPPQYIAGSSAVRLIRTARRIDISRSFVLYLRSFTLYNT